ncbi:MAG: hypothetical protein QM496_13910 [Verrucomicrobiota bacterium]
MDSTAELEFSEQAHDAGRALWPGTIRIAGVDYPAVISRGSVEINLDGRAGLELVQGMTAEVAKSDLPLCPDLDAAVKDKSDGEIFTLSRTGGHGVADAVWVLICVKFEK